MRRDHHPPPAIGVAGWKNSGKTTLVTRLIAELTRRGFKVATVKHAHHDFQIDDAETDSARHRRAGAPGTLSIAARHYRRRGGGNRVLQYLRDRRIGRA